MGMPRTRHGRPHGRDLSKKKLWVKFLFYRPRAPQCGRPSEPSQRGREGARGREGSNQLGWRLVFSFLSFSPRRRSYPSSCYPACLPGWHSGTCCWSGTPRAPGCSHLANHRRAKVLDVEPQHTTIDTCSTVDDVAGHVLIMDGSKVLCQ